MEVVGTGHDAGYTLFAVVLCKRTVGAFLLLGCAQACSLNSGVTVGNGDGPIDASNDKDGSNNFPVPDANANAPDANPAVPDAALPPDANVVPGGIDVAYNIGGAAFSGSVEFAADSSVCDGTISLNYPGEMYGTADDPIYRLARYSVTTMDCNVAVDNGPYTVTLYWGEWYRCSNGARQFDVFIEGDRKENDLDVYKTAGCISSADGAPLITDYDVDVADGNIHIVLDAKVTEAMLSALRIRSR